MNKVDSLKEDIIEAFEEIGDEGDLQYILVVIKKLKIDYEKKDNEIFEELKQSIGSERLNEILDVAQKKTQETDWGLTELKKWLKKQFPSELTYNKARIIAWRICYPAEAY